MVFDPNAAAKAEAAARLASGKESSSEAAARNPLYNPEVNLVGGGTSRMKLGFAYFYNIFSQYPEIKRLNSHQLTMELATLFSNAAEVGGEPSIYQLGLIATRYGVDPATIQRRIQGVGSGGGGGVSKANQISSLAATISDMSRQLGIAFSPEQVTTFATLAQKNNWSSEQVVDEITKNIDWYKLNAGTLKTSVEDFKVTGRQYLVNLSDSTVQNWALAVAKGEMSQDTVVQSIREAAKIANPWLAPYIDKGLNPVDVLTPNRDFIAAGLEIDPNTLDLMDQKVINMMTAEVNGQRQLANQSQLTTNIRNDSRWKTTSNANQLTSGMAGLLASIFGRSAF